MVRRVNNSIAGPRQFDLIHAQAGNIQVDAGVDSAFSLSVTTSAQPGHLAAILRVRTDVPLTLRFATAQEFDLRLIDGSGKVVWKWSEGQVFAQLEHDRTIATGWTTQVEIPQPPNSESPYLVHGWLTTEGDRSFAVALPVTIAPLKN